MPLDYQDEIQHIRSLLIVTSLQSQRDLKVVKLVEGYLEPLEWKPLKRLLIDDDVWRYAVEEHGYSPRFVFCHSDILLAQPQTSLYYRGMCALPIKATRHYVGSIESLENGNPRARIDATKALKMAQVYNTFLCSIIRNSTDWTLENGRRAIIATLGITLDGVMRNKVGDIAELRIRTLLLKWLREKNLIGDSSFDEEEIISGIKARTFQLPSEVVLEFGSEPDVSFSKGGELLAILEIKGGTDPAGALERYGAATKSFQHSVGLSKRCRNFYLAAVFTKELEKRIKSDRLVEKTFNIIDLLQEPKAREEFFHEVFHHTLRLV